MSPGDLDAAERRALYGLLATIADADGQIKEGELAELDALAEELGVDLYLTMAEARETVTDLDQAIALAQTVSRPEARQMIRTVLHDLAQGDGDLVPAENRVLAELARIW